MTRGIEEQLQGEEGGGQERGFLPRSPPFLGFLPSCLSALFYLLLIHGSVKQSNTVECTGCKSLGDLELQFPHLNRARGTCPVSSCEHRGFCLILKVITSPEFPWGQTLRVSEAELSRPGVSLAGELPDMDNMFSAKQ